VKVRKRPVVVDAFEWTDDALALSAWLHDLGVHIAPFSGANECDKCVIRPGKGASLDIQTREGTMVANRGDWIIRGVAGEFYPCKPEIFAATYEAE